MSTSPDLSIGALSAAVGIPVATIRTWERRYGFPKSQRRPSGHRRYSVDVVEKLTLVKELLSRGHRPSAILGSSEAELRELLRAITQRPAPVIRHRADDGRFDEWFDTLKAADAEALTRLLHESLARLGSVQFLDTQLAPFLVEMGLRWTTDKLTIAEEHFASSIIMDFLTSRWRPLKPRPDAPVVVCAVLADEQHLLGIHMAATALALDGWDVRFLGANTPATAVAQMARLVSADAIALGTSPVADPADLSAQLRTLREHTGHGLDIWLGGANVPADARNLVDGVRNIAQVVERARNVRHRARRRRGTKT
jgi:DNA-binding transcriptional MerR regulator/methylmalonyl-CoA mutase cobalamin-binding subunit